MVIFNIILIIIIIFIIMIIHYPRPHQIFEQASLKHENVYQLISGKNTCFTMPSWFVQLDTVWHYSASTSKRKTPQPKLVKSASNFRTQKITSKYSTPKEPRGSQHLKK